MLGPKTPNSQDLLRIQLLENFGFGGALFDHKIQLLAVALFHFTDGIDEDFDVDFEADSTYTQYIPDSTLVLIETYERLE
ncbi:hypothetical protein [Aureicoccus marinus]|uniref:hypothetical protein n=1 Tax=Aureicoccus marinus TaxID=754435 RepID=UPI0011B0D4A1|nr:hypothetical protein [Aureicoccus marinus]